MPENQSNMFEESPDGKLRVKSEFKNISARYPQLTETIIKRVFSEKKPDETFEEALNRLRLEDIKDSKEVYR